jgi:hypothetical protein
VRFGKSDKIQFISTVEGLESIKECLPKPAKHFIPKWFKDIPNESFRSVKVCPSFPDYFSQGYIIPMWADVKLKNIGEQWSWQTATDVFNWDVHFNDQLIDHKKPSFSGVEGQFVFKALCPWRIITPPGWSVLQLPLFYHFNEEWSVMPGVIDTDIHHEINQQVLYHANGKEITIERGDPFVLYIPFKRSNRLDHIVKYQTEENKKTFQKNSLDIFSRFSPSGYYRERQRKRDKGLLNKD